MTQITVQGILDLSNNRLTLNFDESLLNSQNHFVLSQQSNNQESFTPLPQQPSSRQFPLIQKRHLRFYSSALGLAGGIGLVVSCIWSVLLPAIGSVGVMTFAYLANRKITLLNAKGLSLVGAKCQSVFKEEIGSKKDNSLNASIKNNLTEPLNPVPITNPASSTDQGIPPPPPPPPLLSSTQKDNQRTDFMSADLQRKIHKGKELKEVLLPTGNSGQPRDELLLNIRKGKELKSVPNMEKMKEIMEGSSSSSLLKILQCAYERALNVSKTEKNQVCEKYLEGKLKNFKDKFFLKDISTEESLEVESVFKYIETSASLTESMKWIQNLLRILSNHKDLTEENKDYFFNEHARSTQIGLGRDSRSSLLLDIHTGKKLKHTLNIDKINEIIERSSPNLLLKILQAAYEGALNISSEDEKNRDWKKYFESKVKKFKEKVSLEESKNPDIEEICQQAKSLRSLSESMKWIQNLLHVLSNHKDLNDKEKQYYSEKLVHTKTRIKKLESAGNPVAEALFERAEAMCSSDHSDNDDVEDNDSDWD